MRLTSMTVALELSKAIAKTGTIGRLVGMEYYRTSIDGFTFTYWPDVRRDQCVTVTYDNDPFLSLWRDDGGKETPCRVHFGRYEFAEKILGIATKCGIIK